MKRTQRGDTIVEVMIAMTILGVVMMSSYALGNRAARIAQESRDRVKATQIMQEQAEALRWLRDTNLDDFTAFKSATDKTDSIQMVYNDTDPLNPFWEAKTCSESDPTDPGFNCGTDTFFKYWIDSDYSNPSYGVFNITVEWERIGGGTDTTTVETQLGDLTVRADINSFQKGYYV